MLSVRARACPRSTSSAVVPPDRLVRLAAWPPASSCSRPASAISSSRRPSPTPTCFSGRRASRSRFPGRQVCCGQPAFNAGHRRAARRVARTFVRAFSRDAPIVAPSGSCATMVAHYLPELLGVEPYDVWELSAFLDATAIELPRRNEGRTVAYHDSCHMLRELDVHGQPRRLLERSGAERRHAAAPGPVLRVRRHVLRSGSPRSRSRWPTTSWAAWTVVGAEALVTADPGCLMHLAGPVGARPAGPGSCTWPPLSRAESTRSDPMADLTQPPGRFREVARSGSSPILACRSRSRTPSGGFARTGSRPGTSSTTSRPCGSGRYDVRMKAVRDIDRYLAEFTTALEARGGHVKVCATAEEACAYVVEVCRRHDAKLVAKSKSMASEEIGLNAALEAAGIRARRDRPRRVHPPARPASTPSTSSRRRSRRRRSRSPSSSRRSRASQVPAELEELTAVGSPPAPRRCSSRRTSAITGANFAVAETGTIVTVTNEGNASPRRRRSRSVHIAITGIERLVPTLGELAPLLTAARAQRHGPAPDELHAARHRAAARGGGGRPRGAPRRVPRERAAQPDGHEVRGDARLHPLRRLPERLPGLPQDGRRGLRARLLGPDGRRARAAARRHAKAPALPHASSLCGACTEACPVKIPLHELLLELRSDLVEQKVASWRERTVYTLWSLAWSRPSGYRLSTWAARLGQRFAGSFGPGKIWSAGRALPPLARRRFRDWK